MTSFLLRISLFCIYFPLFILQSNSRLSLPSSLLASLPSSFQMADTGIDPAVCFIHDGTAPIPYNSISVTHRKLVTYVAFADRQENTEQHGAASSIGHGTHVASTLVGNSRASAGSALYNGMAPNSKVSFDSFIYFILLFFIFFLFIYLFIYLFI